MEDKFNIQEELKKLPDKPGVYMMQDKRDTIIYVGKARILKNRVRSYFREAAGHGPKIAKMVSQVTRFEYIVTDTEMEALVLENNLIKEYRPKYNTMLKDDKTYPYIKVTVGEPYPRVLFSREMKKGSSRYFGPFTSAAAVKDTIELINKLYQLRTCSRSLPKQCGKERPCLNFHIGKCSGPCRGDVPPEVYRVGVEKALDFLNGNHEPVLKELKGKMEEASALLKFEEAAQYRDLYDHVKQVSQKQKMTDTEGEDRDIIAIAREEQDAVVQVFFVRDGRLIGQEHFYMTHVGEDTKAQILLSFVKQFYAGTPFIPRELLLQEEIEETEVLEQWLSGRRGGRVYMRIPKKGTKEKLMELAARNASMVLKRDKERMKREEGRTIGAVKEIAVLLNLEKIHRMEAFDISNISGYENVGSMVVYEKGKPKKSDYRKFRIKAVAGPDDYACMKEVLTRRFRHGLEEREKLTEKEIGEQFGSFTKFPDVLLMDGGKGQVNTALQVLEQLQLEIPVCGMVKDDNHRTRGLYYENREIPIDRNSEGFKLITRIQEEAHRFAIEYHRSLRSREQVHSVLDDIPGIGPRRRKALMKHFESIGEIREAGVEELAGIPDIPQRIAEEIYSFFHDSVIR
ncbi:MAG: excinuclease ABC subunit UvrC [Lachnospiraceae bacterium]|nr:excinuclease ABC subunit UvrC [Lachnospiraceae bacterium]